MQTVTEEYKAKSRQAIRPITYKVLASFNKTYSSSTNFFTIGTSTIGGKDIIKGENTVIQEWDKYDYQDISDRVLSIEYTRESEPPIGAVTMAMADVVLDNHDGIFDPINQSGPWYGRLGAGRPFRLYMGFTGAEQIQMFIGLSEGVPVIDEKNKTVRFHLLDFIKALQGTKLNESIITVTQRTDQVISTVLQAAGLSTSQFSLDTGSVVIPFAYFPKDSDVGKILKDITQAELGGLYMDENGLIRFENRINWASHTNVWEFTEDNVIDMSSPDATKVINSVEIKSDARSLQDLQKVYISGGALKFTDGSNTLAVGETKEAFVDFKDEDSNDLPVTGVVTPTSGTINTSGFDGNTAEDGSGTSVTLTLASISKFSTAVKLSFTNAGTKTAYVSRLELWGYPAPITNRVYALVEDSTSIDQYEVQRVSIENNYIQDDSAANSIGAIIINERKQIGAERTMVIKGVPQLQVGDRVSYSSPSINETYYVNKISGILNLSDGFKQTIDVGKRTIQKFFTIGVSTIGSSTDVIAP